jgi:peroxiredoxin
MTAARFKQFGAFDYPVVSDAGNALAQQYSIFKPATQESAERLLHATFVIDPQGVVRWCHYGLTPFTDNATLLVELAKIQGQVPEN